MAATASQHFLLSARARALSVASVARLSEEEARAAFRAVRWADTNGEPVCPRCACAACYAYATRPLFKCKACGHQFSVTSGTIFAARKMAFRDILLAVALVVNGAKGLSALQLSRDLDCQYKTAFVLAHKRREALAAEQKGRMLSGHVEVDGAYFGGHIRQENRKADRKDRRLAVHQTGKRRCVVALRERGGRVLPFVVAAEDEAVPIVRRVVATGSTVYADEAAGWDALHAKYETRRINHSIAFMDDGACTNQAESYFARLRRSEIGVHHRIGHHLGQCTPPRWRGGKIRGGRRTGHCTCWPPGRRSGIRSAGRGPGTGSGGGSSEENLATDCSACVSNIA